MWTITLLLLLFRFVLPLPFINNSYNWVICIELSMKKKMKKNEYDMNGMNKIWSLLNEAFGFYEFILINIFDWIFYGFSLKTLELLIEIQQHFKKSEIQKSFIVLSVIFIWKLMFFSALRIHTGILFHINLNKFFRICVKKSSFVNYDRFIIPFGLSNKFQYT